jgi:hypothetical protein
VFERRTLSAKVECVMLFNSCVQVSDSDATGFADASAADDWPEWKTHSHKARYKLQMMPEEAPWTSNKQNKLRGVPKTARYYDVVDIAFGAYLKGNPGATGVPKWSVDISQNPERRCYGEAPGTIAQGSLPYLFELDRVMTAEDAPLPAMGPSPGSITSNITLFACMLLTY